MIASDVRETISCKDYDGGVKSVLCRGKDVGCSMTNLQLGGIRSKDDSIDLCSKDIHIIGSLVESHARLFDNACTLFEK